MYFDCFILGHIIMLLGIGNWKCETDGTSMRSGKYSASGSGKDSSLTDLML